jgi:hypothetical protein
MFMHSSIRSSQVYLAAALAALLSLVSAGSTAALASDALTLTYRGKLQLTTDTTTDQNGAQFKIEGLSGVAHCGDQRFIAIMDNSNHLVYLDVAFKPDGSIDKASVAGGQTVPTSRDYEGVVYTNPSRNSVFISNEATPPPPAVYEYSLDKSAKLLQTVDMPKVFRSQIDNRGLESLTRRVDGKEMWTANEEALSDDGDPSTTTSGSVVRLVRLKVDGNSVTPAEQYAYQVDPIHPGIGKPVCSGLSDLTVLPNGTLLTLERSAMEGLPVFETRIYQVDFTGATDVSQGKLAEGLKGQTYTPVGKKLLIKTSEIAENLEGLCVASQLSDHRWALLGVVDNGDPLSKNTLVAFELEEQMQTAIPKEMIIVGAAAGGIILLTILVAIVRGIAGR